MLVSDSPMKGEFEAEAVWEGNHDPDLNLYTETISLFKFKVALLTPLSPTLNSTNFSSKDIVWKSQVSALMNCEFQFKCYVAETFCFKVNK